MTTTPSPSPSMMSSPLPPSISSSPPTTSAPSPSPSMIVVAAAAFDLVVAADDDQAVAVAVDLVVAAVALDLVVAADDDQAVAVAVEVVVAAVPSISSYRRRRPDRRVAVDGVVAGVGIDLVVAPLPLMLSSLSVPEMLSSTAARLRCRPQTRWPERGPERRRGGAKRAGEARRTWDLPGEMKTAVGMVAGGMQSSVGSFGNSAHWIVRTVHGLRVGQDPVEERGGLPPVRAHLVDELRRCG